MKVTMKCFNNFRWYTDMVKAEENLYVYAQFISYL